MNIIYCLTKHNTLVEKVKTLTDIVDLVGEVVDLKRKGNNYWGLCPFHQEKTPSFSVSRDKQMYYCFGCHAGGNVFGFVRRFYGLTFPQAKEWLAQRAGINITTSAEDNRRLREAQTARKRQAEAKKQVKLELKAIENELVEAEKRCDMVLATVLAERDLSRLSVVWAIKTKPIIESILNDWFRSNDKDKVALMEFAKVVPLWPFQKMM